MGGVIELFGSLLANRGKRRCFWSMFASAILFLFTRWLERQKEKVLAVVPQSRKRTKSHNDNNNNNAHRPKHTQTNTNKTNSCQSTQHTNTQIQMQKLMKHNTTFTPSTMIRWIQVLFLLQHAVWVVQAASLRNTAAASVPNTDCDKPTASVEIVQYQMTVDFLHVSSSTTHECSATDLRTIGLVMQSTMTRSDHLRREFEIVHLENHISPQQQQQDSHHDDGDDDDVYHYVFRGGGKCHFCYDNAQQEPSSSLAVQQQQQQRLRSRRQLSPQEQQLRQLRLNLQHQQERRQHVSSPRMSYQQQQQNNNNMALQDDVSPSRDYFSQKIPALEWSLSRHLEQALADAFVHSPQSCLYAVNPDDIEVAVHMELSFGGPSTP